MLVFNDWRSVVLLSDRVKLPGHHLSRQRDPGCRRDGILPDAGADAATDLSERLERP
ncbi:MAG: hypothetical protein ABI112_17055 [Terracoccus sp.]